MSCSDLYRDAVATGFDLVHAKLRKALTSKRKVVLLVLHAEDRVGATLMKTNEFTEAQSLKLMQILSTYTVGKELPYVVGDADCLHVKDAGLLGAARLRELFTASAK
jgi:hypothetical protein